MDGETNNACRLLVRSSSPGPVVSRPRSSSGTPDPASKVTLRSSDARCYRHLNVRPDRLNAQVGVRDRILRPALASGLEGANVAAPHWPATARGASITIVTSRGISDG